MITDIFSIGQWWLVLFVITLIFFPLIAYFFSGFADRGYIFAKIFGTAAISYMVFFLGVIHVVPFSMISSWIVLIVTGLLLYGLLWHQSVVPLTRDRSFLFKFIPLIIFEEVCFFITLAAWSFVRAYNPDIFGLEKYMDFGFVNTILKSTFFPPKDMWYAPYTINYYYFGHFVTAVITKLSGIPSVITYNLMIATLFALSFVASFSIGLQLCRSIVKRLSIVIGSVAGILTAIFVTLSGNLHILYGFFKNYDSENVVPFWQLPLSAATFPNAYWYPQATRFIHNTIHEFPLYSWVVADLHGHVTDIPFVLLTISLLLAFFFASVQKISIWKHVFFLLLLGFVHAVMYMTNAWDGAIYLLLTILVLLFLEFDANKHHSQSHAVSVIVKFLSTKKKKLVSNILQKHTLLKILLGTFINIAVILFSYIAFSFPFSLFFKPFVSGIGVLCAPTFLIKLQKLGPFLFEADHCQRSPFWQLLILYGFFFFFIYSFLFFIVIKKKISYMDIFVSMLIFIATLLIIIPEFIYMKDIYPAHYRANTMFKLVFQSFIMLSIASIYIFVRIITNDGFRKLSLRRIIGTTLYCVISFLLMSVVLLYPSIAINSYYAELKTYKGLNGVQYLAEKYPDDFAAIQWLDTQVKGQPTILEAQGDGYTEYGRVSVHTGLPTVLGWLVHEWLWRGDYSAPAARVTDIETMYKSTDITMTKKLLKQYNVSYVFVGDLEREKYPGFPEDKFDSVGKIVYQRGTTKVYKL